MATARDVVLIGVIVFAIAMGLFAIHFVATTVVNQMVGMNEINQSSAAVDSLTALKTKTLPRLDYVIFGLFIGLILALMIVSWFVGGNPIFMIAYIIVVIIGVILSTILANVWEDVSGASVFGSTITQFPLANNILLNLPFYIATIGFIGLVVMFAKPYVMERMM